jgi:hypothetical protein
VNGGGGLRGLEGGEEEDGGEDHASIRLRCVGYSGEVSERTTAQHRGYGENGFHEVREP